MYGMTAGGPIAMVRADPFAQSPQNPVNMSRTPERFATGHAPSGRVLDKMREASRDLVLLATTPSGWKFLHEKNNTMVYEMNGRALPSGVSTHANFGGSAGKQEDFYVVRGVTTVQSSGDNINAVLDLLLPHFTGEYKTRMREIFGHKTLNNAVVVDGLSCLTPPARAVDNNDPDAGEQSFSEDDAYSVNWLSLRQTSGMNDRLRDLTLLSFQDCFEMRGRDALVRRGRTFARENATDENQDEDSRLLGVHAMTSINFRDIPELPKSAFSDRVHLRNSGFVIEQTQDPNSFRLSVLLSFLPTKLTLKHMRKFNKWLQQLALSAGNLATMLRRETISSVGAMTLQPHAKWKNSDHCFLCLKVFHTFRRCHHCRFCGEAVCNNCSGFVMLPGVHQELERKNSNSSIDMRSYDESSYGEHQLETRGCLNCIRDVAQCLTRKSSSSISSMSTTSSMTNTARSAALPPSQSQNQRSYKTLPISQASGSAYSNAPPPPAPTSPTSIISYDGDDDSVGPSSFSSNPQFSSSQYQQQQKATRTLSSVSVGPQIVQPQDDYHQQQQPQYPEQLKPSAVAALAKEHQAAGQFQHQLELQEQQQQQMLQASKLSLSTASSSYTSREDSHLYASTHDLYASQASSNASTHAPPLSMSELTGESFDLSNDPDIMALAGLSIKPSAQEPVETKQQRSFEIVRNAPAPKQQPEDEPAHLAASSASVAPRKESSVEDFSASRIGNASSFHFSVRSDASSRSTGMASTMSALAAALTQQQMESSQSGEQSLLSQSQVLAPPPTHAPMPPVAPVPSQQQQQQQPSKPFLLQQQELQQHHYEHHHHQAPTQDLSSSRVVIGKPPVALRQPPMHHNHHNVRHHSSMASAAASPMVPLTYGNRRFSGQGPSSSSSASSTTSSSERNDMIPLAPPPKPESEFVFFSDSKRDSLFVRPSDGSDMIPLDI